MKRYTLRFSKPVVATDCNDPAVQSAQRRAIQTRRQAIKRKLARNLMRTHRKHLADELQLLANLETQLFGIRHRATALPIGEHGKPYVPRTRRGRVHVPLAALPLNHRGRRYVPTVAEIVETAVFTKFIERGNIATALARLAVLNPGKYGDAVETEARKHPKVRRAMNRARSDARPKPLRKVERFILENFYASYVLKRPLCGVAWDQAAQKVAASTNETVSADKYRRILRKFLLA